MNHIIKHHPRDKVENEVFKYTEPLGYLPFMECCVSEPTQLAKELGVGPTLFLMSTRAMAGLFFILTLVNIPLFGYYYAGTKSSEGQVGVKGDSFDDYFALLSLGNAGTSGQTCSEVSFG